MLAVPQSLLDSRIGDQPQERAEHYNAPGVPLRSNNLPIGSLCILDVKPRRFTEREKRLLQLIGEDVMEEIKRRENVGPPSVLVA